MKFIHWKKKKILRKYIILQSLFTAETKTSHDYIFENKSDSQSNCEFDQPVPGPSSLGAISSVKKAEKRHWGRG